MVSSQAVLCMVFLLCHSCPCFGHGPPGQILFNELHIDEEGSDSHFIEFKRVNSGTPLNLDNHHLAILNSNRKNGFHLEVCL